MLQYNGEVIFLDVGISGNVKAYLNIKKAKYKGADVKCIPIIFGKDCTVHKESLEWLKKFGIKEN